jgi:hypothetical protein
MYIKHLILAEKWEREREKETVTKTVIDFEYVYMFIDTEKSLYRF